MSKVYFKGCTFWAHHIKEGSKTGTIDYGIISHVETGSQTEWAFSNWLAKLCDEGVVVVNCGVIPPYVTEEEDIHIYSNGGQP